MGKHMHYGGPTVEAFGSADGQDVPRLLFSPPRRPTPTSPAERGRPRFCSMPQLLVGAAEEALVAKSARHAMSVGYSLDLLNVERRIGRRHPVGLVHLMWQPELPAKWFRRTRPQRARVVDLSVTGACIQAPTNDRIQRGTMATIDCGAHRGLVQVRRIQPAPDPTVANYGVEFVSLDPKLRDLLNDVVEAHRPSEADWHWQ